jgi:anti-sigma factor RsiW
VSRMAGCRPYRKQFSAYLDSELPLKKRAAVAEHLAVCAACRKELEDIEELGPALMRPGAFPPPADLAARIMAEARRRQAAGSSAGRVRFQPVLIPSWSWWLKAGGTAALVVLLLYFGQWMSAKEWLPGGSRPTAALSTGAEGLEWFAPAPPESLLSGYLAIAPPSVQATGQPSR